MEFLISNWFLIIVGIAVIAVGGYMAYVFIKKPTNAQLDKLREWLLFAVAAAEKELGSGTGQIKLRQVYDMFLKTFSHLAKIIPFSMFSDLVDEALDKFREMLKTNEKLQNYIEK